MKRKELRDGENSGAGSQKSEWEKGGFQTGSLSFLNPDL